MGIAFRYSGSPVASMKALVAKYPCDEFDSPQRSTIPSIAFWSNTDERVLELCTKVHVTPPKECTLEFEYRVAPPDGRGKKSHTDAMLWWSTTCIAFEAKYTEGPYQRVSDWLREGTSPQNRTKVLAGWCALIAATTGRSCDPDALNDATYQMIHRIASVCSRPEGQKHVVYQLFDPQPDGLSYYRSELRKLKAALSTGSTIGIHICTVGIQPSEVYSVLVKEWKANGTRCNADVIAGLINGTLLRCGACTVETI